LPQLIMSLFSLIYIESFRRANLHKVEEGSTSEDPSTPLLFFLYEADLPTISF